MNRAVCLLAFSKDAPPAGQVPSCLVISRRHSATQWGMPGGKVDPGESEVEALIREVREETGLALSAQELLPLYSGLCVGNSPGTDYWTTSYLLMRHLDRQDPALCAEEGLLLDWQPVQQLREPTVSPFHDYNNGLCEALVAYADALRTGGMGSTWRP